MRTAWISRTFYTDHKDRDLPTPPVIAFRGARVVIDADHPAADELLNDARYYADPFGPASDADMRSLRNAATRTIKAIERARA